IEADRRRIIRGGKHGQTACRSRSAPSRYLLWKRRSPSSEHVESYHPDQHQTKRMVSSAGLRPPRRAIVLGLFSVALQFEPGKPVISSLRAREISVRSGQESILNDHRRSSSEVPKEPSIDLVGEFAPSLATQQTRSYAKHFASAG